MNNRIYFSKEKEAASGGKFISITQRLLQDERFKNVSPTAKTVFIIICLFADESGKAFPSIPTIAAYIGVISERSIIRAVKELKTAGLLEVLRSEQSKGKQNSVNVYTITAELLKVCKEDINKYFNLYKHELFAGIITVLPIPAKIIYLVLRAYQKPIYDMKLLAEKLGEDESVLWQALRDGEQKATEALTHYATEITITELCEISGLSWPTVKIAVKQLLHVTSGGNCIFSCEEDIYCYDKDGPGWYWKPDVLNRPGGISDLRRDNYSIYETSKPTRKEPELITALKKIKTVPITFDQANGVFLNVTQYHIARWSEAYPNCDIKGDLETLARLQVADPKTLRRLNKGGAGQAINNYLNKQNRERRGQS